jgi:hypothetical protein
MTSVAPPTYYFPGITFNSAFYTTSSSGGLSEAQANSFYLRKNTADTATALETFTGGIASNSIESTTATTSMSVGSIQTDGILNLGTGSTRTATGVINIGNSTGVAPINIQTGSLKNTDSDPAIRIGTSALTRTIKIGSTTDNNISLGNLDISTRANQVEMNMLANKASNTMYLCQAQTTGGLNIGSGGGTSRTGAITIGSDESTNFNLNLMNGAKAKGTVNVLATPGTGTGALATAGTINLGTATAGTPGWVTTAVNIGSGTTTGTVTIGNSANTTNIQSGTVNIKNGTTATGSVNIASGTGINQFTTVDIGSGTTTGTVTIGNSANSILLNAPTTVKSTKESIIYLTASTNTLTEANILASNLFGSTYSSDNPSTANNSISVNIPTPTSAMEGMTLVFRKVRGVFNTGSPNWLFTCPTSSMVLTSLTTTATPTGTSLQVNATVARLTIMAYSGSLYYFAM